MNQSPDGGFEPAEAEIAGTGQPGSRQIERRRGAPRGRLLDGGTAGIWQTEHPRHLVEGLARGIVPRATDDAVFAGRGAVDELGVATRDDERHEREGWRIAVV